MTRVAISGGGLTGLSAAIYTSRADRRTLVFDDGGGTTREVDTMENVYGFPDGVTALRARRRRPRARTKVRRQDR